MLGNGRSKLSFDSDMLRNIKNALKVAPVAPTTCKVLDLPPRIEIYQQKYQDANDHAQQVRTPNILAIYHGSVWPITPLNGAEIGVEAFLLAQHMARAIENDP